MFVCVCVCVQKHVCLCACKYRCWCALAVTNTRHVCTVHVRSHHDHHSHCLCLKKIIIIKTPLYLPHSCLPPTQPQEDCFHLFSRRLGGSGTKNSVPILPSIHHTWDCENARMYQTVKELKITQTERHNVHTVHNSKHSGSVCNSQWFNSLYCLHSRWLPPIYKWNQSKRNIGNFMLVCGLLVSNCGEPWNDLIMHVRTPPSDAPIIIQGSENVTASH